METPIQIFTVGYPIRERNGKTEILMGLKAPTENAVKRGIAGKVIGYGGRLEPDKDASPIAGFVRELTEESGDEEHHLSVSAQDVEEVAHIRVKSMNDRPDIMLVYLLARNCSGETRPSREISECTWYPTDALPDNVLDSDKIILPRILAGEKIDGWILYDKNMKVVETELDSVESFS